MNAKAPEAPVTAVFAVQPERKVACPAIAHRAVLAAGVDEQLRSLARLEARIHPVGGVVRKVVEASERAAVAWLDGRLGVRSEEVVAPLPEPRERAFTACPVQVADAAAPIHQVQQALGVSGHRPGLRPVQLG